MSQTSTLRQAITKTTYLFVGMIACFILIVIYHYNHEFFEKNQVDTLIIFGFGVIFSALGYGFFSIQKTLATVLLHLESKQKEIEHLNHLLEQKVLEQTAELKYNQEELAKSEQRLSFALKGSTDALWDFDILASQIYFNRRWFEMLGYAYQDKKVEFAFWEALLHPDDCAKTIRFLKEHLEGQTESYVSEHRLFCKNGEYKWFLSRGQVVERDANGNALRAAGTLTEIHQRKLLEADLRLSASIFAHLSSGLIITDAHGIIQSVNPAFSHITGYPADEVLGKSPKMLQSGRQTDEFYTEMWTSLKNKGYWQGELWNRRKNGEIYPQFQIMTAIRDENNRMTQFASIFTDITERKRHEELIHYQAYHDILTGLPNRSLFYDRLNHCVLQAKRHNTIFAVLFLDLDRFKSINDTFGHDVGDALLKEVAQRLQKVIRESDTVSRFAGDEFTIILPEIGDMYNALQVAQKILDSFEPPVVIGECVLTISSSIGISLYPIHGEDADILLKHADQAMYRAKQNGRQNIQVYSEL